MKSCIKIYNVKIKMNVNRVLVFKSLDAKKQDPNNKPGNFTTKFIPEMKLVHNKQYYLVLDHISMTYSWHNIAPNYNNNELKFSKDRGRTYQTISFISGTYDYKDLNSYIQKKIGKIPNKYEYGINILFYYASYKVFIAFNENYYIDYPSYGNFNTLLGFEKKN